MLPARASWLPVVERALAEDLGTGDVTTRAVLAEDRAHRGRDRGPRERSWSAARRWSAAVFALPRRRRGRAARARRRRARAAAGAVALRARGLRPRDPRRRAHGAEPARPRSAAVATHTRRFVDAVAGTGVAIVDTRKTLAGLARPRQVRGGGRRRREPPPRASTTPLLVKDNHLAAAGGVRRRGEGGARRARPPHLWLQVEVESEAPGRGGPRRRRGLAAPRQPQRRRARARSPRASASAALLEASGGRHARERARVAETGVHRISIGALTHSAPHVDVALEVAAWPGARR